MRSHNKILLASAISLSLMMGGVASAAPGQVQFLTGAQVGDAKAIALGYLESARSNLGLSEQDVAEMDLRDDYRSKRSGIRHLYWNQQHQGIDVYNGVLAINVARDGSVINLNNGFVSDLATKVERIGKLVDKTLNVFTIETTVLNVECPDLPSITLEVTIE